MGHGRRSSRSAQLALVRQPFRPRGASPTASRSPAYLRRHEARRRGRGAARRCSCHQLPIWVTCRSAEGKPLFHDPRRRQCGLCSVTSLRFVGPHLADVGYAEPAAASTPGRSTPREASHERAPHPAGVCWVPSAARQEPAPWPPRRTPATATPPGTPAASPATGLHRDRARGPRRGALRSPAPPTTARTSPPPSTTARCSCSTSGTPPARPAARRRRSSRRSMRSTRTGASPSSASTRDAEARPAPSRRPTGSPTPRCRMRTRRSCTPARPGRPNAVPSTLVLDHEGRVAARVSGAADPSVLRAMIDAVVGE